MRTSFISQLVEEARINNRIFLIVGDLGYNVVEKFTQEFPDRYLNAGIAEQNMIGVAAGLAMQGYIVYVYSIGNFPTLRCMEQIRNDVAYHHTNVRIVSIGAGFAYGSLGATHHATEELGMMRTLPDMVVCSPCDPVEAKFITTLSANYNGPMYLRLGKAGEQVVHENGLSYAGYLNEIGTIYPIIQNHADNAVFSTGSIVASLKKQIEEENLSYDLYSFPFIKPISKSLLKEVVAEYKTIVCVEEHQLSAGFGSAVVEAVNDLYASGDLDCYPKIIRKGIQDTFYHVVGNQKSLRHRAGLEL